MIAADPPFESAFDTHVSIWSSPAEAARAGGDWCDAFAISEHAIAVTIGDVAGHGEAVAGTMAAMRSSIVRALTDTRVPSDVLARANDTAARQGEAVIVTAIVAVLDHRLRTLTFANAGHPAPLMLTRDAHAFLACPPADLPLGIFPKYHAAEYVVALSADTLLVFYTDGITEHGRDPVRGEVELVSAARLVYDRPELNAARAIARRMFHSGRGSDDAAAIGLRTTSRGTPDFHGFHDSRARPNALSLD